MIKGVNKQVLEISETQNGFFEKAIFFVKPEYSGMGEGRLRESAKKEFDNAGKPPVRRGGCKNENMRKFIVFAGVFIVGLVSGICTASFF